jgi:hypothetical protein
MGLSVLKIQFTQRNTERYRLIFGLNDERQGAPFAGP